MQSLPPPFFQNFIFCRFQNASSCKLFSDRKKDQSDMQDKEKAAAATHLHLCAFNFSFTKTISCRSFRYFLASGNTYLKQKFSQNLFFITNIQLNISDQKIIEFNISEIFHLKGKRQNQSSVSGSCPCQSLTASKSSSCFERSLDHKLINMLQELI